MSVLDTRDSADARDGARDSVGMRDGGRVQAP